MARFDINIAKAGERDAVGALHGSGHQIGRFRGEYVTDTRQFDRAPGMAGILSNQHMDPSQALDMLTAINATHGLGIHWCAFPRSDESRDAAAEEFSRVLKQRGAAQVGSLPSNLASSWMDKPGAMRWRAHPEAIWSTPRNVSPASAQARRYCSDATPGADDAG